MSFNDMAPARDGFKATGYKLSDNMEIKFWRKKMDQLLDSSKIAEAMDAVSKSQLDLTTTAADALNGLLCEGASKVIRHIFPTKLPPDTDASQAEDSAKKSFASLTLQAAMDSHSPELKHVCVLTGVPSEPSLADLQSALEAATAAQKVVDGKRVVTNCLAIFALSKVGKALVKTCAASVEAKAKDAVKVVEAERASEKIKAFEAPETIEIKTVEEVAALVSDLCHAFVGVSADHQHDSHMAKAACDSIDAMLTQVVVKAACQWSEQINVQDATDDSENDKVVQISVADYERQLKVLEAVSNVWRDWHTKNRAIVLKEQGQPEGYLPMTHFIDIVTAGSKILQGQEFDKELSSMPDAVVISFGKRLLACTSDCAPTDQFRSEVMAKADWLDEAKRSHFDQSVDWLQRSLTLRLEQISAHLTQTFAQDAMNTLSIKLSMTENCWAEDGSLRPDSDLAKAASTVDLAAELVRLDTLAGASSILAAISGGQLEQQDIRVSKTTRFTIHLFYVMFGYFDT